MKRLSFKISVGITLVIPIYKKCIECDLWIVTPCSSEKAWQFRGKYRISHSLGSAPSKFWGFLLSLLLSPEGCVFLQNVVLDLHVVPTRKTTFCIVVTTNPSKEYAVMFVECHYSYRNSWIIFICSYFSFIYLYF